VPLTTFPITNHLPEDSALLAGSFFFLFLCSRTCAHLLGTSSASRSTCPQGWFQLGKQVNLPAGLVPAWQADQPSRWAGSSLASRSTCPRGWFPLGKQVNLPSELVPAWREGQPACQIVSADQAGAKRSSVRNDHVTPKGKSHVFHRNLKITQLLTTDLSCPLNTDGDIEENRGKRAMMEGF
jgi:hypothetical protein